MSQQKRQFKRSTNRISYRRLFIIASEGAITELDYFDLFRSNGSIVIKYLKGKDKSAPLYVLKRMQKHLKEESMKKDDEAWLVVDKDEWKDEQLMKLYEWSKSRKNCYLAVSNPKFEYWILLHFEEGQGIVNAMECTERLKKHIKNYKKSIKEVKFDSDQIRKVINTNI